MHIRNIIFSNIQMSSSVSSQPKPVLALPREDVSVAASIRQLQRNPADAAPAKQVNNIAHVNSGTSAQATQPSSNTSMRLSQFVVYEPAQWIEVSMSSHTSDNSDVLSGLSCMRS